MLKDAPTAFGAYSPENFDGRFEGPISARDALIRSSNVPAVALAAKLSRPNLYDLLKAAGISQLASEEHYGLALALGGGELNMEELVQLYAMLGNYGVWRPVRYRLDARPAKVSGCCPKMQASWFSTCYATIQGPTARQILPPPSGGSRGPPGDLGMPGASVS